MTLLAPLARISAVVCGFKVEAGEVGEVEAVEGNNVVVVVVVDEEVAPKIWMVVRAPTGVSSKQRGTPLVDGITINYSYNTNINISSYLVKGNHYLIQTRSIFCSWSENEGGLSKTNVGQFGPCPGRF
jgi:hypothetical protein